MASGGFRTGAGRPKKVKFDDDAQHSGSSGTPRLPATTPKGKFRKEKLNQYFDTALRECADVLPTADEIRKDIERYIERMGCATVVAPQLITDYVINRQGFLACEGINRKLGRTTSDGKVSPYVTAAQVYYKAMREAFNMITQLVLKFRDTDSGGGTQNAFLDLLMSRGF